MLRKKNKFRNDPRRRSGVSKRDPGESCDSPKLFWVRGSEAVRGLLTCWAQSPGSGQNQVETKLLLRQQYAMPQVAHNSWRKKMEESKMTRRFGALNAKDHIPVTLWPGLGYSLWIPELTIFPFWATEWKYYLTGQFWLESKTLPKVEEWYRWLEFRCSGQNSLCTISEHQTCGGVGPDVVSDARFPQLTNEVILPQGEHLLQEDQAPGSLEEGHAPSIYEWALPESRGRDLPQQNQRGGGVLPNSANRNDGNGESLSDKLIFESDQQIKNKNKDNTNMPRGTGKEMKWSSQQVPTWRGLMVVVSHS